MNDDKNDFPPDGEPNDNTNAPKPVQIRCKKCGFLFPHIIADKQSMQDMDFRDVMQCPSCNATIWASASEAHPSSQRKKYEIVCCPSCGRHNKNVTEDSVKCELCGKILDTDAYRLGSSRPKKTALRTSLIIMLIGWIISPIFALASGSHAVEGFISSITLTIWIAILPLIIHFLQRTSPP